MTAKMTERAARQLKAILKRDPLPETTVLRISAEPAEDEGKLRITLILDIHGPQGNDEVETTEGVRFAVHKALAQMLDHQIDFREDIGGFVLEQTESAE